jgi:hypothetical protein
MTTEYILESGVILQPEKLFQIGVGVVGGRRGHKCQYRYDVDSCDRSNYV